MLKDTHLCRAPQLRAGGPAGWLAAAPEAACCSLTSASALEASSASACLCMACVWHHGRVRGADNHLMLR